MMDYTQIAECAGTPLIATAFAALLAPGGGPQVGIYALTYAQGNCIGMESGHVRGVVAVYPGTILGLAGDEANDNHLGTVVWN